MRVPFDAAREMVRVTRPGGKIVMGNWIPGDPTLVAQILKISSASTPPPPEGFVSPMLWGVESNVIERFEAAGVPRENISFSRETFTFEAPISSAEFVSRFRNYYGPAMNAFEAAEKNGKASQLQQELLDLFDSQNQGSGGNSISIPATFLRVPVSRCASAFYRQSLHRKKQRVSGIEALCFLILFDLTTKPQETRRSAKDF
jgi:hypothetical protein